MLFLAHSQCGPLLRSQSLLLWAQSSLHWGHGMAAQTSLKLLLTQTEMSTGPHPASPVTTSGLSPAPLIQPRGISPSCSPCAHTCSLSPRGTLHPHRPPYHGRLQPGRILVTSGCLAPTVPQTPSSSFSFLHST